MEAITYTIRPEEDGAKLLRIIRGAMKVSYTQMKAAKWGNRLLLDGVPAHTDAVVRAGQTVTLRFDEAVPSFLPQPFDLPLTLPYEDEHLLIVDKPAPLPAQDGPGEVHETLENALFSYFGCDPRWVYRPVNRLDKGTSGLMAVALTPHAQQLLQKQLHTPDMTRRYLAVTDGIPQQPEGILDAPIAKMDGATVKRCVSPDGKPSRTHYRVVATYENRALVELQLETGRTHQIRVHLASVGCPVFGDFLYGTESPLLPGRFALHSHFLTVKHPITGETLTFVSPLPAPLAALMGNALPQELSNL